MRNNRRQNGIAARALALLLSMAMCFTMSSAFVFAAGDGDGDTGRGKSRENVNLLVFGNSTTHGYGMPDSLNTGNNGFSVYNNYLSDPEDKGVYSSYSTLYGEYPYGEAWSKELAASEGQGHMSYKAYPWQLKKYIENSGKTCTLNPICLNGMRTDELRAYLDEDYYNDVREREAAYKERYASEHPGAGNGDGFLTSHIGWYASSLYSGKAINEKTYAASSEYVKNSIRDADVIVVDLCGNNFGTYLGYRLSAVLGLGDNFCAAPNTYETIGDIKDLPAGIRKKIVNIEDKYLGSNEMLGEGIGRQLIDTYLYSVADCIANFTANMKWINANKKDGAKVIAVGLDNVMEGFVIDLGDGKTIDFGGLTGALYNTINTYIKSYATLSRDNYYADISAGVTTFASGIADAAKLDELRNDKTYGNGKYSIEMMYKGLIESFNVDIPVTAEDLYKMIASGIQTQISEAAGDLAATAEFNGFYDVLSSQPISFELEYYIAQNEAGVSTDENDSAIITKGALVQMIENQLPAEYKANAPALAKQYYEGESVPEMLQPALGTSTIQQKAQNMVNGLGEFAATALFTSWDELNDDSALSFKLKYYLTLDISRMEDLFNAIGINPDSTKTSSVTTMPLSRMMLEVMVDLVAYSVEGLIYNSLHSHNVLDLQGLMAVFTDPAAGGMDGIAAEVSEYVTKSMVGDSSASMRESTWGLLNIYARYLLYSGVGSHPNGKGCDEKYEFVLAAYKKATGSSGQNDGQDAGSKNLLVFGDSTSSGYGLPDFSFTNDGFDVRNNDLNSWKIEDAVSQHKGRISNDSHPWLLKNYIAEEAGLDLSEVNLSSMCLAGMRTDELRALLDPEYCSKTIEKEAEQNAGTNGKGFVTKHVRDDYVHALADGGAITIAQGSDGLKEAQEYTKAEIAKADYIVVDVCTNNFGTYLAQRISGQMGLDRYKDEAQNYWKQSINDIDDISDRTKANVNTLINKLEDILGVSGSENDPVKLMIDAIAYCYADCVTNFSADIELINKYKKPGAKVIVVGVYNSLDGIDLVMDGRKFPLGKVGNLLFRMVNAYIRILDKNSNSYYYADLSDGLETFVESISYGDENDIANNFGLSAETQHVLGSMTNDFVSTFIDIAMIPSDPAQQAQMQTLVKRLLIKASKIKTADLNKMIASMNDRSAAEQEIRSYLAGGGDLSVVSDDTLGLINVYERFLLEFGLGQHPSKTGCHQKYEAVREAFDEGTTSCSMTVDEIKTEIASVLNMLRNTSSPDFSRIIAKLQSIKLALGELKIDSDELKELKDSYEEALSETISRLEARINDLTSRSGFISNGAVIAEISGYISKLYDLIDDDDDAELIAAMGERVDSLEEQIAMLKAKSASSYFTTSLKFKDGKAVLKLTLNMDPDADSYRITVNGKEVKYNVKNGVATYTIDKAVIGKEYTFEAVPLVTYRTTADNGVEVTRVFTGYSTSKTVKPKVSLDKAGIKSVKAGRKSAAVKWGKVYNAGGYQISYRTGKVTKKIFVKSGSKVRTKIKGLKKGAKYTIRVRAYRTVYGKNYYGKWSNSKTVKSK